MFSYLIWREMNGCSKHLVLFSDFERLQGPVIALFSDLYVLLLPEVK